VGIGRESSLPVTDYVFAINNTDSNTVGAIVADGYPSGCSRGLMQVIPWNFAHYHEPNTSYNIYDPIANIAAGMNYLMSRYHVTSDALNLSAVQEFNPSLPPMGY
jgi:SLT domain-containing protein